MAVGEPHPAAARAHARPRPQAFARLWGRWLRSGQALGREVPAESLLVVEHGPIDRDVGLHRWLGNALGAPLTRAPGPGGTAGASGSTAPRAGAPQAGGAAARHGWHAWRSGPMAWRTGSGGGGRCRWSTSSPSRLKRQTDRVRACRSLPPYAACPLVSK